MSDEQEKGLPPQATSPPSGPSGIGGWLILPAIGLVGSPILLAVGLFQNVALFDDPELATIPGFRGGLMTESALNAALLVFVILTCVAFFRERPVAPRLVVAMLSLNILVSLLDAVIWRDFFAVPEMANEIFVAILRAVVSAAIWIPYFLVSKRVKNTFVLRRSEATIALVSFDDQIKSYRDWLDFDIIQRERMEAQLTADQKDRLRQLKSSA